MNIDHLNKQILQLFPLANSEVTAYEAYTEFWAEIMNAAILAIVTPNSNKNGLPIPTLNEFLKTCEFIINCERNFGMYQLVKVLKHMNLSYFDLINIKKREEINTQPDLKMNCTDRKRNCTDSKRNCTDSKQNCTDCKRNCYKENTNVLSYYVLKNILLNNYNEFLDWCDKNNTNTFQFVKTEEHLQMFYKFIEKYYKSKDLLEMIDHAEKMKSIDPFICQSMRMTCCESV